VEPLQIERGNASLLIRSATLVDGRYIILFQEISVGQKIQCLQALGLSNARPKSSIGSARARATGLRHISRSKRRTVGNI
jgi:hypothetical protein